MAGLLSIRKSTQHTWGPYVVTGVLQTYYRNKLHHLRKGKPTKLNSPLLIARFPGPGLVGSISTSFIIETLKLRQIACVESEFIVPGVIYVGGKLRHRFRLYANNEGTICVIVCETPILVQGIYHVLDAVMKWALESSVTSVLVLEGIPMQGIPDSKRHPFILSNSEENHTLINNLDEFDMNVKQSEKESQADVNKNASEYNYNSENLGPTYIDGISGGYCLPAFPTISHLSPSLFPFLAVFLILRAQQSYSKPLQR
jgi:hypothetical protein